MVACEDTTDQQGAGAPLGSQERNPIGVFSFKMVKYARSDGERMQALVIRRPPGPWRGTLMNLSHQRQSAAISTRSHPHRFVAVDSRRVQTSERASSQRLTLRHVVSHRGEVHISASDQVLVLSCFVSHLLWSLHKGERQANKSSKSF